jgi:CO/xanthine dehydrogenase FAD-binding subunit
MSLVQLPEIEFSSPRNINDACAELARLHRAGKRAWALAGCTDWMVEQHMSSVRQERLDAAAVDISSVPELRGITVDGEVVTIGAAEPFLSMRRHSVLQQRCPMLVDMASEVGAIQIQARGTLGGNLVTGSPAADGVTALFALDADVVLRSQADGERTVPITSYYTGYRASVRRPDELVVRLSFRLPAIGASQLWRKVGTRKAQSISKAAVAAVVEVDSGVMKRVGVAAASVAEVILPLAGVRAMARGKAPSELDLDALEEVIDREIRPIDDVRSTQRYRRHVTKKLVRRFFEEVREGLR